MLARAALLLIAVATWDAWRLLIGRVEDGLSALLVLALLCGVAVTALRDDRNLPAWQIAAMLSAYAIASVTGPALLQIGAAVVAIVLVAHRAGGRDLPRLPLLGLALLALPLLPTLDFLLAWPLRRVSAILTTALLRSNGVAVAVDGIALAWQGKLLLFDGPCSGIRMLWAALLLASLAALVGRFTPLRYLGALAIAVTFAIIGNALRAASLFYVENGFVPSMRGQTAHEAVGIMAFVLLAAATLAATAPRVGKAA